MQKRDSENLPWLLAMGVVEDLKALCSSYDYEAQSFYTHCPPGHTRAIPPAELFHSVVDAKLQGYVRARDIARILHTIDTVWLEYHSADARRLLRQIRALFCKNAQFSDNKRCTANGIASFKLAERICAITNKRLQYYHLYPERLDPELARQMEIVHRTVTVVLGHESAFLASIPDAVRLTSGATENTTRARSLPHMKLRGNMRCAPGTVPLVKALYQFLGIEPPPFTMTVFNRVSLVDKNWSTKRVIACESKGVLPLQLAFDSYVKARLLECLGIDLGNQQRNFEAARESSLDGQRATVDMRMASDLTSLGAVFVSTDRPWFDLLLRLRASHYRLKEADGTETRGRYAKFSSMGNGCTFGLETLLFAASCIAVGSKSYLVYGDDIVIETHLVAPLLRLLRHLGFRENTSKTFVDGDFRESCGGDFTRGVDITPFYLRKRVARQSELCLLINGLAATTPADGFTWAILRRLYRQYKPLVGARTSDPCSNVWVDVPTAYKRGLLRYKQYSFMGVHLLDGIAVQRQYAAVDDVQRSVGSRSRYLWYVEASKRNGDHIFPGNRAICRSRVPRALLQRGEVNDLPYEARCTSSVSIGHVRHRERRAVWYPPYDATPGHLYRWSDYLLA